MKFHKQGSALLIIFFIVNTVILFCWLVWRSTSWSVDLVMEKQCYEQQRQAMNALWYYAQLLIKDNYQTIIKDHTEREIRFNHWPEEKSLWNASITIKFHEGALESKCALYNHRDEIASKKFLVYEKTLEEKKILYIKPDDDKKREIENPIS